NGVDYIVATVPGKSSGAKYPLEIARDSVKFFESYFGSKYNLPKLHLIAVPEFAAGAMENWGAITFREIVLLVDKDSSIRIKKQVAEVIAHEVSHQWFGDLVTMKWWDDLWLNESFATFMAYKATDSMFPQWTVWQDFVLGETAGALERDSPQLGAGCIVNLFRELRQSRRGQSLARQSTEETSNQWPCRP